MHMSLVSLRLRELRERKGWSQAELARRAGMHNSVVNRAERGQAAMTLSTLEKLAKALGVSPRSLIANS
jgi:transcriptional regulator with XRE-family HTH domain